MADLYVRFLGIYVFERAFRGDDGQNYFVVDMPNAASSEQQHAGHHGAEPHTAWVVSNTAYAFGSGFAPLDTSPGRVYRQLTNAEIVTFQLDVKDGETDHSQIADEAISFKDFATGLTRLGYDVLKAKNLLAGRVMVRSGELESALTNSSIVTWHIDGWPAGSPGVDYPSILYEIEWHVANVTKGDIRFDGKAQPLPFAPDGNIYLTVGNLPTLTPEEWPGIKHRDCPSPDPDPYHHFWWLYTILMDAPPMDMPVPVGTCADTDSPPEQRSGGLRAITTSTCVPGEWP
jgi:hypothetical protein